LPGFQQGFPQLLWKRVFPGISTGLLAVRESDFADPIHRFSIVPEPAFVRSKLWSVDDEAAVSGARGMPDVEKFMVEDVIENKVWYSEGVKQEADHNRVVRGIVPAEYAA
jgi:hypothetical protein